MRMLYERAIDIAIGYRPTDMSVEDFLLHAGIKRPGPAETPPVAWSLFANFNGWLMLWCLIVGGHVAVWLGLTAACVLSALKQPWYITMIAISFCVSLLLSDGMCPVTRWENYTRRKMGWKEVGHFTHWYVICPIFHGRVCARTCAVQKIGPK
jgi:hypothetical protein